MIIWPIIGMTVTVSKSSGVMCMTKGGCSLVLQART